MSYEYRNKHTELNGNPVYLAWKLKLKNEKEKGKLLDWLTELKLENREKLELMKHWTCWNDRPKQNETYKIVTRWNKKIQFEM